MPSVRIRSAISSSRLAAEPVFHLLDETLLIGPKVPDVLLVGSVTEHTLEGAASRI